MDRKVKTVFRRLSETRETWRVWPMSMNVGIDRIPHAHKRSPDAHGSLLVEMPRHFSSFRNGGRIDQLGGTRFRVFVRYTKVGKNGFLSRFLVHIILRITNDGI